MASILICGGNLQKRNEKIKEIYHTFKEKENDPDSMTLESTGKMGIDEIREIKHWLSLKPFAKPPKIVIIPESQNLTQEAQASLSKILEEPPGEAVIILSCQNREQILVTLSSRCQIINLKIEEEINLTQEEIKEKEEEIEKILKFSIGDRVQFCEKFKNREEAQDFCQIQLYLWRKRLLEEPTKENREVVKEIIKTIKYIGANVNYRLAVENLLLFYPLT